MAARVHSDSACIVVSDSRLDNRPELLRELGITKATDGTGDGELLLAAYQRWGVDCANRLLGDFAFAIGNARKQRLFCARDPVGVRPFYFHHAPSHLFVFGSEPKASLQVAQVPRDLDEGRIGDCLDDDMEYYDYTSSFFSAIKRLQPAHHMQVDDSGMRQARYWRPTDALPFGVNRSSVGKLSGLRGCASASTRR